VGHGAVYIRGCSGGHIDTLENEEEGLIPVKALLFIFAADTEQTVWFSRRILSYPANLDKTPQTAGAD